MIRTSMLGYQMLAVWRGYVIFKVKAPLQKAIERAATRFTSKFGKISKTNTCSVNVHSLLDIQEWFFDFKNLNGRRELIDSAFKIIEWEIEHDPDYRFVFDVIFDEVLKKIIAGEWEPNAGVPNKLNWPDPPPYSREKSIVSKILKHRLEILKIIEEG